MLSYIFIRITLHLIISARSVFNVQEGIVRSEGFVSDRSAVNGCPHFVRDITYLYW